MQPKIGVIFCGLSTAAFLSTTVFPSNAHLPNPDPSPQSGTLVSQYRQAVVQGVPIQGCLTRPKQNPPEPNLETRFVPGTLTLERFRRSPAPTPRPPATAGIPANVLDAVARYRPTEKVALAHPTNFGERYLLDYQGQSAYHKPIIVLHETVISEAQTIKLFQTNHPKNSQQVSYHTLIGRDGTLFYIVPPDKRAFGAGNSVFSGSEGDETVSTNPSLSQSVNNFSYHISFVSPTDGRKSGRSGHSGYTTEQYYSLAWLASKTGVPIERITTHQGVDRSGTRSDPRSFNRALFLRLMSLFPQTNDIAIGCPNQQPSSPNQPLPSRTPLPIRRPEP